MMELETMNRLFLELSQFVTAKTARELELEAEVKRLMEQVVALGAIAINSVPRR